VWRGAVRRSGPGEVWRGEVSRGLAGCGVAVEARHVEAMLGMARSVKAVSREEVF